MSGELESCVKRMLEDEIVKLVISNPATKSEPYKKIVIDRKKNGYQISRYTEKQVFHENVKENVLEGKCLELAEGHYRQLNGISEDKEHIILISKKGACNYKVKNTVHAASDEHNRKKNYLLREGMEVAPLVDMAFSRRTEKLLRPCTISINRLTAFWRLFMTKSRNGS